MDINNALGLLNSFASEPLFVDKFALACRNAIALQELPAIEVPSEIELKELKEHK